jgi:hypothetical protein
LACSNNWRGPSAAGARPDAARPRPSGEARVFAGIEGGVDAPVAPGSGSGRALAQVGQGVPMREGSGTVGDEALPGEAPPGEALPDEALPDEALPGEALPGEALPGEALPSEALPGEALPGEALPGEALPGEALPGEALSGEARSGVARDDVVPSLAQRWPAPSSAST